MKSQIGGSRTRGGDPVLEYDQEEDQEKTATQAGFDRF